MIVRFGLICIVMSVLVFFVLGEPKYISEALPGSLVATIQSSNEKKQTTDTILFVGDIMMGRHVENLIEEFGEDYPFRNVMQLFESHTITVGNFEGVVSEEHSKTPSMVMRFSVRDTYLTYLTWLGFDVLSLANNHSLDYGHSALSYTRLLCKGVQLSCIGSPTGIDESSATVVTVGQTKVGIISLHTLYSEPSDDALFPELEKLTEESDIQIAYIHWGNEYELKHNRGQELFAQKLIDHGIDAVIGHHPHVIQDIDIYSSKPIFYSLGNFVFDQYFSTDVQEGIGVQMIIADDVVSYQLIPFKSTKSQPDYMSEEEVQVLYSRIFADTASIAQVNTERGAIVSKW